MAPHPGAGPAAGSAGDLAGAPVTTLRGVGERLARLGVRSVQDLLLHLPLRYEDRTRVTPIGALAPGETAVVEGEVELASARPGRRAALVCLLGIATGHDFPGTGPGLEKMGLSGMSLEQIRRFVNGEGR